MVRARGGALSRRAVEGDLRAEGLTPHAWSNEAGFAYGRHTHGYRKVLICLSGSIIFHTEAGDIVLGSGDRMELPPGIEHSATVGDAGVRCVEAYRPS